MHGTVRGTTTPREYDAAVEAQRALFGMSHEALAMINAPTNPGRRGQDDPDFEPSTVMGPTA